MRKTIPVFAATAEGSGGRAVPMRSEEAQVGKRVRVREDHRKASLRGQEGTIVERWGNPGYAALDVLLDDGGWHLFWYHELEEVDDSGARHGREPVQRQRVVVRVEDVIDAGWLWIS